MAEQPATQNTAADTPSPRNFTPGEAVQGRQPANGHGSRVKPPHQLARALGWFSVGLGLAEVMAPKHLARFTGISGRGRGGEHTGLMRTMGMRELAAGIGILTHPQPAGWMQARVGGDALDLGLLGAAFGSSHAQRGRLLATTAMVAGVTALDMYCARQLQRSDPAVNRIEKSITINLPAQALHDFLRNPGNMEQIMGHFGEVRATDNGHLHWTLHLPRGKVVEWDTEILEDKPGELLRWQSLPGAAVYNEGSLHLRPAPQNRGTEVSLHLHLQPPGGILGSAVTKLLGPLVMQALRRCKSLVETGEIPTLADNPTARSGATANLI